jgi:hypothetical protein
VATIVDENLTRPLQAGNLTSILIRRNVNDATNLRLLEASPLVIGFNETSTKNLSSRRSYKELLVVVRLHSFFRLL